jgi:hypothetical protein
MFTTCTQCAATWGQWGAVTTQHSAKTVTTMYGTASMIAPSSRCKMQLFSPLRHTSSSTSNELSDKSQLAIKFNALWRWLRTKQEKKASHLTQAICSRHSSRLYRIEPVLLEHIWRGLKWPAYSMSAARLNPFANGVPVDLSAFMSINSEGQLVQPGILFFHKSRLISLLYWSWSAATPGSRIISEVIIPATTSANIHKHILPENITAQLWHESTEAMCNRAASQQSQFSKMKISYNSYTLWSLRVQGWLLGILHKN